MRIRRACRLVVCFAMMAWPVFGRPQQADPAMNHRGDHVMGFSHDKTTHHFLLTKDGGVIQVQANEAADAESRDHIRMHLQHIAKAFASGDFEDPMEVHAQLPPGVPVMKERKEKISYRFQSIERGGKVVIRSYDGEAVKALHEYLKFQIEEHKTGDPLTVQ